MALLTFSKTVLKNLFSEPETLNYPATPREYPERSRGHIEIDIENCIFCGMCMRNCPPRAITVDRAKGTWTINRFDCIQCNYCSEVCPKKCLHIAPGYCEPGVEKVESVIERPGGPLPMPKPPVKKPVPPKAPAAEDKKADEKAVDSKTEDTKAETSGSTNPNVPRNDIDNCVFCTLCARNCPVDALTVNRAEKVWEVDEDTCVGCGMCVNNCPKKCLSIG